MGLGEEAHVLLKAVSNMPVVFRVCSIANQASGWGKQTMKLNLNLLEQGGRIERL